MRQTAAILTLVGVLTLVQATFLAVTQDWSKIFDALGMIDDFTISYWLVGAACACAWSAALFEAHHHHEHEEPGRHRLHGNDPETDGVALGERPPASINPRAHAMSPTSAGRPSSPAIGAVRAPSRPRAAEPAKKVAEPAKKRTTWAPPCSAAEKAAVDARLSCCEIAGARLLSLRAGVWLETRSAPASP